MDDEVKNRFSSGDTWIRLLFIVIFGFCATIATWLIWVVAAAQFLFALFAGKTNDNLSEFADTLVAYVAQAFSYMVYRTDAKPFPFAPPPKAVVVEGVAKAAAKTPRAKRASARQADEGAAEGKSAKKSTE